MTPFHHRRSHMRAFGTDLACELGEPLIRRMADHAISVWENRYDGRGRRHRSADSAQAASQAR
ncbi:hypothetical protein GCM10020216_037580 [Nonomuraea helvata]